MSKSQTTNQKRFQRADITKPSATAASVSELPRFPMPPSMPAYFSPGCHGITALCTPFADRGSTTWPLLCLAWTRTAP